VHIRAERDDLVNVLARVTRAVAVHSSVAALQGVLWEAKDNRLRLTGSDLDMTVRSSVEVEVREEGNALIPGKLGAEAVRKLPPGVVNIRTDEGKVEISGNGPEFNLRLLAADDYPRLTEVPKPSKAKTVDGALLATAISQVTVASSQDDARPVLTGTLFESEGGSLRMVCTDSYRLGVRDLEGVPAPEKPSLAPARGLRELSRTIGAEDLHLMLGEREANFVSEMGSLTVRLIEGTFPNYRQLIPASYPNQLRVEKAALVAAVDRATLVAGDHIPVRLELGDEGAELSVLHQEVGTSSERLESSYKGDKLTIAFNPRYLSDGLAGILDEEVLIDVTDGLKPAVIRGAEDRSFFYLLMPVRL